MKRFDEGVTATRKPVRAPVVLYFVQYITIFQFCQVTIKEKNFSFFTHCNAHIHAAFAKIIACRAPMGRGRRYPIQQLPLNGQNVAQNSVYDQQSKLDPQKDRHPPRSLTPVQDVRHLAVHKGNEQEGACDQHDGIVLEGGGKIEPHQRDQHSRYPAARALQARKRMDRAWNSAPRTQHDDKIHQCCAKDDRILQNSLSEPVLQFGITYSFQSLCSRCPVSSSKQRYSIPQWRGPGKEHWRSCCHLQRYLSFRPSCKPSRCHRCHR